MSLFGHKVLDNKDISTNSLVVYKYNNNNSTLGYNFNGNNIQEKNGNAMYLSINSMPEFNYASYEELRLADYEKTENGNIEKYKIIDTSGSIYSQKNTFLKNEDSEEISISSNTNNLFGNINRNNLGTDSLFRINNPNSGSLFGTNQNTGLSCDNPGGLFGNNNNQNTGNLFGNNNNQSSGGGLFSNNNQNTGGLFGNNNNQSSGGGLFSINNQNTGGLFGNNNNQSSNGGLFSINNQNTGGLFGNNKNQSTGRGLFSYNDQNTEGLFENNNQNTGGLFRKATDNSNNNNNIFGLLQNNNEVIDQENNAIKIPRNNMKNLFLKERKKCFHENNFTSYNIEKVDDESGLLCYNCLYKYYKNNIQNCIPIKDNNFENYKKFYKDCINKYKVNLQNIFKEIISEIEKYENEEIDNISTLFDEKVDLKFKLPVEIPFIERFEIAINRKIISLLDNKLFNGRINHNFVNLFQNELKELKLKKNNPNEKEIIKIRSSIDFNIFGIALPKIPENEENNIEMDLSTNNIILNKITKFENYENLSIGLFDTNIIKINKNADYFFEIKGIKNLDYISNDEEYNENTKLEINSNNQETVLAALIIE